jgi:hypothetical protein
VGNCVFTADFVRGLDRGGGKGVGNCVLTADFVMVIG